MRIARVVLGERTPHRFVHCGNHSAQHHPAMALHALGVQVDEAPRSLERLVRVGEGQVDEEGLCTGFGAGLDDVDRGDGGCVGRWRRTR